MFHNEPAPHSKSRSIDANSRLLHVGGAVCTWISWGDWPSVGKIEGEVAVVGRLLLTQKGIPLSRDTNSKLEDKIVSRYHPNL